MDIEQIKSLAELMVENDLSRVELREGETHILLRRGQPVVATPAPAAPVAAPAGDVTAPPKTDDRAEAAEPSEAYIRSPMVGTFYTASDPESQPFVNVGDEVNPESVVCIVEAMKVFNEIKAETTGRLTKILVKNAQAVEYDQPLFAVAPA